MSNLHFFIYVVSAIIIIMVTSQICGRLMKYIGQPAVVGEMIAGVLLGPTLLGYVYPDISANIFTEEVKSTIFILCNLGLSIYMFLVGIEIDYSLFKKSTIKQATVLSLTGTLFPFILGIVAAIIYYDSFAMGGIGLLAFSIFMGTALAITAFPMLARILHEKGLINSKIGVLSLLSASIQDVASWIMLSFVTAMAANKSYVGGLYTMAGAFVFVGIVFLLIKPLLSRILKNNDFNKGLSQSNFSIILILLLMSALATDYIGLYSVFGGFILGLAMPRIPLLIKALENKLKDIMIVLFLPLFFAYSGLNTNLLVLDNITILVPCLVILLFSVIGKYGACTLTVKLSGYSWGESSAIGGLLNSRGLMELIIANIGLFYGIISRDLFSILVLMAIITTLAAMPIYNISMRKVKNVENNIIKTPAKEIKTNPVTPQPAYAHEEVNELTEIL